MSKKKVSKKTNQPSTPVPPPEPKYRARNYSITYEYRFRGCYEISIVSTIPSLGPTEASARLRAGEGGCHELPGMNYIPEDAVAFVVGPEIKMTFDKQDVFVVAAVRHWNRTVTQKVFNFFSTFFD